jgi:hypothetical protein
MTESAAVQKDSVHTEVVAPAAAAVTPQAVFPWADHAIGIGLAVAYVTWLLRTSRLLGFSRDESFYFDAAGRYEAWFKLLLQSPAEACSQANVDNYWSANHEHPSLLKGLFALSNLYLFEKNKLFHDQSDAYRFPGMLMAGLGLWVVYLFGKRVHSRSAGIGAAVALALMPRIFYHSHLACFDVPVMTMWVLCIYVYYRASTTRALSWAVALGIVYGLTLETKHNSWMLPPLFILHTLLESMLRGTVSSKAATAARALPAWRTVVPWHLLAMATIGPALFVGLWPWLWRETVPRFQEYVSFHVNHDYYNIEFLHKNYWGPPSPAAYAPVMIMATVPTVTVLLFVYGVSTRIWIVAHSAWLRARTWVRERNSAVVTAAAGDAFSTSANAYLLWLMGLAVPLSVFFLPSTPIFGGTKHWFPAYPFFVLFAGVAFAELGNTLKTYLHKRAPKLAPLTAIVFGCALVVAPLAETVHSHPFGLSAYVPYVGGTRGAADIGLYRQFWGFTTQSLNDYLVRTSKGSERIFIHDTTWGAFYAMQNEGRLPKNLTVVGDIRDADIAIVHHELHMIEVDANIMTVFGHPEPDFVLNHDGVPIISLWRRHKQ